MFQPSGGRPLEPREWDQTARALRRRGPDGGGIWCNGRALLGARRLAVMDPTARAQMPMISPDQRFVLSFNGEIYDHVLQRPPLRGRGWNFATESDTETVLAALSIFGPEVLDDLNGMFALAFYDSVEHRLLLARDHAGIKPLYVSDRAGSVAFCSEFDTLLASPACICREVDPIALVQYLDYGHIFAPRTFVRNVALLEPGESRSYSGEGRRWQRYDRLKYEVAEYMDDEEAVDAFGSSLRGAVVRQSRSDASVGYLLSGGVDSRLLAILGAGGSHQPIRTFSVGNEPPLHDESPDAAAEAQRLHANHRQTCLSERGCEALFSDAVSAIHEPSADEGALPSLLVFGLARETARVVLSGEGADELLFGYNDRHQTSDWSRGAKPSPERYRRLYREFHDAGFEACFPGARKIRAESAESADPSPWTSLAGDDESMEWMRKVELHTYLPFVLMKTDRASMFHSVEARVPFLDKDVLRTALRIRPRALFDSAANRGKLVSHALLERAGRKALGPKRGFTAPVELWLRGPLRSALETTLRRLAGLSALQTDRHAIGMLARDHLEGRADAGMALWRLMILDHWADRAGF